MRPSGNFNSNASTSHSKLWESSSVQQVGYALPKGISGCILLPEDVQFNLATSTIVLLILGITVMVKYTLKEEPEVAIEVPGRDSAKARQKAMDQLMDLMEAGKLNTSLDGGFGINDFIVVKTSASTESSQGEDEIVEAVQILNKLASLKLKMQESKQEALDIRALVDLLFTDDPITEADVLRLKDGFKVLKKFAQANIQFRDARTQAESAREILDRALQSEAPEQSVPNGAMAKGSVAKNS